MARILNRLTGGAFKAALRKIGRHGDGGGLTLVVGGDGSKRWMLRWTRDGKTREMGLGRAEDTKGNLALARQKAEAARLLIAAGGDPIAERQKQVVPTFGDFADDYIKDRQFQWRNEKHRAQWTSTLSTYCTPIRDKPVNEIETIDVLGCLKPIWLTKAETASRLRGRIEAILDAARAAGHRTGENPAVWKANLKHLLPTRPNNWRDNHHAALPYVELPAFMASLRWQDGTGAAALEFTILTATRSGEVRGATWSEIDIDAAVWIVPAERMKGKREHRIPLIGRALEIVRRMSEIRQSDYVFPGRTGKAAMNDMTLMAVLRRMGRGEFTVHGFRSSFRDWCGDETRFTRDIIEAALAHVLEDKTEAAYRRGDALVKRRELMAAWDAYCKSFDSAANVLPFTGVR